LSEAHRQEENISYPRGDRARWERPPESGRGEGGLFELPVEVGPADFPVAEGIFEVHGAFPGLRGLGKLAQIGDLGQVKVGQIVDQVCYVGAARSVGHFKGSGCGKLLISCQQPLYY
jgi:hypothetical protein